MQIEHFHLQLIHKLNTSDILHIYLSGDGHPWLDTNLIAKDPTPSKPIALQLMSLDPNSVLYLGRPCYHLPPGASLQAPCKPSLWTFERYSETVVQIMTKGIAQALRGIPAKSVTLIGFSGGGVLATLIGERLPQVGTVISIASNLDVRLWSNTLGYSPLKGSLNPNSAPELRKDVKRIHLVAGKDRQVPSQVIDAFIQNHGGQRRFFADFDHHCCWQKVWPDIISDASKNRTH